MKKSPFPIPVLLLLLALVACSSARRDDGLAKALSQPDDIRIFSVPLTSLERELKQSPPRLLKDFPFVSRQPAMNFRGKFSPEFYAAMDGEWKAVSIRNADFWRLRSDPGLYDVIYMEPLWRGEFQKRGNDLLESIACSFNIPMIQRTILEDWIRGGGILWLESAIYISTYDYRLGGYKQGKLDELLAALRSMTLFDTGVGVQMLRAQRSDDFHVKPLRRELVFNKKDKPGQVVEINKKIRSLLLEQNDYVGVYLTVDGVPLVTFEDTVYARYIRVGKGLVITTAPFDFTNAYYDGELFRLALLFWALENRR